MEKNFQKPVMEFTPKNLIVRLKKGNPRGKRLNSLMT